MSEAEQQMVAQPGGGGGGVTGRSMGEATPPGQLLPEWKS
jgi:hypothetical protein